MLRDCTFSSIYTTTWCYVDWGGGVGGWWGMMLTLLGLAHLRDATRLHVLFNLHNYVMLRWPRWGDGWVVGRDVNAPWTCTLTWCCYATARSLQFTQLRDATLLHVLFNLHNYVMLRWLGWVWSKLFFPIFTEKWRLWWGQRWIHLCDVVVSNMCGDIISKLVHHWSCWKSWQSWWKTTMPTTAKRVEKRRFDAETL